MTASKMESINCVLYLAGMKVDFLQTFFSHRSRRIGYSQIEREENRQPNFLPKAMNNKILKSLEENINMNFLYVGRAATEAKIPFQHSLLLHVSQQRKFMDQFYDTKRIKHFHHCDQRVPFHTLHNFRQRRNWRKLVYFRLIEMEFIPYQI